MYLENIFRDLFLCCFVLGAVCSAIVICSRISLILAYVYYGVIGLLIAIGCLAVLVLIIVCLIIYDNYLEEERRERNVIHCTRVPGTTCSAYENPRKEDSPSD
jgi:hypothetical protein